MKRRLLVAGALVIVLGGIVSTGASTGADEVVSGVYLDSADSANGDAYVHRNGDTGEIRIEIRGLAPESRTVIDDVFTISTSNDYSRVWLEHGSDAVEFYRTDTREPIDSPADAVELSAGETIHVGIEAVAGRERVLLEAVTIRAEISSNGGAADPTATATPATATETPAETPPQPPTATPAPERTRTPAVSTPAETSTESATPTPTGTTTLAPTLTPNESRTVTPSPRTEANDTMPTESGETPSEAPSPSETPTTAPGPTVSTPTESLEIGGLSPLHLAGLAGLLASVGAGLLAWRARGSAGLSVAASPDSGLDVAPDGLDPDHYDRTDGGFRFRFAETETWQTAAGDSAASFQDALTLTNASAETVRVVASAERGSPDDIALLVDGEGVDLSDGALTLAGGESVSVSVTIPSDFDGDLTIRFDAVPGE